MSRHAENIGIAIPQSAPMDASKLNHTPAPLPPLPSPPNEETSLPLRSPDNMVAASDASSPSGYLDGGEAPAPSHPTVAETGALSTSPGHGPGPSQGQLQRRESQAGHRIIRLASFGGEGLAAKPLVHDGEQHDGQSAVIE